MTIMYDNRLAKILVNYTSRRHKIVNMSVEDFFLFADNESIDSGGECGYHDASVQCLLVALV